MTDVGSQNRGFNSTNIDSLDLPGQGAPLQPERTPEFQNTSAIPSGYDAAEAHPHLSGAGRRNSQTSCYANALQRRKLYADDRDVGSKASSAKSANSDNETNYQCDKLGIDAPRSSQNWLDLKKDMQKTLFGGGQHHQNEKKHLRQRDHHSEPKKGQENSAGNSDENSDLDEDDASALISGESFHQKNNHRFHGANFNDLKEKFKSIYLSKNSQLNK